MKYEIITVGSAVIDAFVDTKLREKNGEMFLPVGEKLLVEHLGFSTGGGGTNAATGFIKLGLKAAFLGKLGTDENSKLILKELAKNKIDFLGIRGKEPTGYSVILDSKFRDRTILTYRGANESFGFGEVNLKKLNARWFYFSAMNEVSLDMQVKLSKHLSKVNAKIAYNPGKNAIVNEREKVLAIIRNSEIVIVNDLEAEALVGSSEEEAFEKIRKFGPRIVVITYGENGSKIFDGNYLYRTEPNEVEVVERTGAGDAFASGFVSAYIKLDDVEKASKIGALNAESVIQEKGAKDGLLNWKEAIAKMNRVKVSRKKL